jgi:hypothetical protein
VSTEVLRPAKAHEKFSEPRQNRPGSERRGRGSTGDVEADNVSDPERVS